MIVIAVEISLKLMIVIFIHLLIGPIIRSVVGQIRSVVGQIVTDSLDIKLILMKIKFMSATGLI